MSSTSDYYSGSDFDYDDDNGNDVVKAAPQYHSSSKETNLIFQTLLQHHSHQPFIPHSCTIKNQQSIKLLKVKINLYFILFS